jgi:hypothetical protein
MHLVQNLGVIAARAKSGRSVPLRQCVYLLDGLLPNCEME